LLKWTTAALLKSAIVPAMSLIHSRAASVLRNFRNRFDWQAVALDVAEVEGVLLRFGVRHQVSPCNGDCRATAPRLLEWGELVLLAVTWPAATKI
jgi:hypothetical protein